MVTLNFQIVSRHTRYCNHSPLTRPKFWNTNEDEIRSCVIQVLVLLEPFTELVLQMYSTSLTQLFAFVEFSSSEQYSVQLVHPLLP
jgi:hypothetical protein